MTYRPYVLLPVALLLAGCDSDGWTEFWSAGTSKALALCISKGEKQNLGKDTVRRYCLSKHQRPINDTLVGHARYASGTFQGSVTNTGDGVIVTEYTIVLKHARSEKTDTAVFAQRLVEPQHVDAFEISKLSFFPMEDSELSRERFSWQIKDVKGVKIDF